ncbi:MULTISPECIES: hypothetical protein [Roseivirga]|uniref:Uncharacterized protein n=1 Tax=Roseivirga spongicola TaxID=333140 RepID=A0A150X1S1_9BACT|nr:MULTISPECIES: hypothetical protein [Roseivirga]KYG72636.1 hypothetical protein AWW68_17195 [Roseivirga spongicola]MBO6659365.1 hypothetical protein [Roseivirga sp.]MBO6760702.1 hypothetical protein [Roseivirga sp.]MBO6907898.1 hypothetical protein [Roseivirga sp.]WPZ10236.1 hypothetical protein T7867_18375 [Roseivirga spongicola]
MKKATMKTGLLAMALMFSGSIAQAQQATLAETVVVDGWGREEQDLSKLPKMEKDIVILQNVLGDLFGNGDSYFSSSRSAKGMYIPGGGVIFSMSSRSSYGALLVEYVDVARVSSGQSGDAEEEVDVEEFNKKTEDAIREKSKEFLTNYGSLLSELKSGEKLMLNVDYSVRQDRDGQRSSGNRITFVSRSNQKRMQSSISYKTLNDFSTGKINLQQAMSAVETSIIEDAEKDMTDAKILAGILDDLMQSSMDGKFRRRSKTNWTYFDGFGLMLNIQMSTSMRGTDVLVYSQGSRVISRVDESDKEKERADLAKELEEAYPEFENMLKENIIQYGRTLRSLGAGESVIVNVDFGSIIRDSKMPRSIRMIIPKSSIDAYAKGQKSLEQVKKEIDIKKLQGSVGSSSTFIYNGSSNFFPAVYETVPEPPAAPVIKGTSRSRSRSNR